MDLFYRHDAKSNVCKDLVLWSLTEERMGAHDGFFAIGSAIEFLLTRLGRGAVAHRVAVESVVGPRLPTPLQSQIAIEVEELNFQVRACVRAWQCMRRVNVVGVAWYVVCRGAKRE